ncbi:MAG: thioredoxin fold domain-containing protein [Desulfobacterales bacterium]|nr:MAG: thioredoxin fold domain-containing protein [Desulfobacterales bacterium]
MVQGQYRNMEQYNRYNSGLIRFFCLIFAALSFFLLSSCDSQSGKNARMSATDSVIIDIDNTEHFNQIWEKSGEQLLMFEFYADWCAACKELHPVLEKIARENSDKVTAYKINTDRNSELMYSFRVTGIPHVAFIKNKENVFSMTGLYPQNMYLKIIEQFAETAKDEAETADVERVEG